LDRYEAVAAVLMIYLAVLVLGHVLGVWKRIGASVYGPVLLWRTKRGIDVILRLARWRRVWATLARAGTVATLAMMVILTLFLFAVSYAEPALPRAEEASGEVGPGLPTESLISTLVYGGLGITIAVFVHELGHGAVAAAHRLRLDSVGILFVAIPIGAFVEPNDDDMAKAPASTLVKVYAAGAAANILVAVACMMALAWVVIPAAEPVEDGVIVTAVAPDSPGSVFGLGVWSEIVAIGDDDVVDATSFEDHWFDAPGGVISVSVRYGDERRSALLPQGLAVTEVLDGPAENAGLKEGMIITSLNGTFIHSEAELRSVVENSTHEEPIPITVLVPGEDPVLGDWFVRDESVVTVNLTSKWIWYYTHYNYLNEEEYKDVSFMGIGVAPFGLTVVEAEHLTDLYAHPYANMQEPGDAVDSTVRLLALPFIGYSPLIPPATDLYEPGGLAYALPDGAFWALVNILYWAFWGNVMLGFANALPALPFDGGYMFRNLLRWVLGHPRSRLKGIEKVTHLRRFTDPGEALMVKWATFALTLATLALVAWLLLDPWI
jgi:membrane-associated protease RseP (regulator of RpoE activity)